MDLPSYLKLGCCGSSTNNCISTFIWLGRVFVYLHLLLIFINYFAKREIRVYESICIKRHYIGLSIFGFLCYTKATSITNWFSYCVIIKIIMYSTRTHGLWPIVFEQNKLEQVWISFEKANLIKKNLPGNYGYLRILKEF